MIKTTIKKMSDAYFDQHLLEITKKAGASLGIKVITMVLAFATSVYLGRTLGADGLGKINLANKILSLFTLVTALGLGDVIMKEVAIGGEKGNFGFVHAVINRSKNLSIGFGLFLTVGLLLLVPYFSITFFKDPSLKFPLTLFIIGLIPFTLISLNSWALRGMKFTWQANTLQESIGTLIRSVVIFAVGFFGLSLTVDNVAIIYLGSFFLVFIISQGYLIKTFKPVEKKRASVSNRYLLKTSLPLLVVSSMGVLSTSTDTIMLGWLESTAEVGLYSVASRLAFLTNFLLIISNSIIAPKIASLYAEGKIRELELMVQKLTLSLIIVGIFTLFFYVLFGQQMLTLWGEEFGLANKVLILLAIGQFINVCTGAVGYLLTMCGYERLLGKVSITFGLLNIFLNFFFIKIWGAWGAALATAITIGIENFAKAVLVYNRMKIMTLPFFLIRTYKKRQ
ncbi:flippase [Xanthovirga aplysinae]|uniref:flippase n=1 Tax=Xanthovirga aplysinae TaxID=2529853 RepID=UPI0012BC4D01|nr:flippase [Xanthovirga aplysinae]MTI32262.1 flippase [Xanthovirga aplysinae]